MAEPRERVRWYTLARKFPRLVGRFHDGTRIPGGPYTSTQVGMFIIVAGSLWATKNIWGTGWVVIDVVIILPISWAVAFLGGLLPIGARNPVMLLSGLLRSVTNINGNYDGGPLPRDKTTHTEGLGSAGQLESGPTHTLAVPLPDEPEPALAKNPSSPAPPVTIPATASRGPATGLERLLVQTGTQKD